MVGADGGGPRVGKVGTRGKLVEVTLEQKLGHSTRVVFKHRSKPLSAHVHTLIVSVFFSREFTNLHANKAQFSSQYSQAVNTGSELSLSEQVGLWSWAVFDSFLPPHVMTASSRYYQPQNTTRSLITIEDVQVPFLSFAVAIIAHPPFLPLSFDRS